MPKLRKFINSNAGLYCTIALILAVFGGIMIGFVTGLPSTHISVALRNGEELSGSYSGWGSLYGISVVNDNGNRKFYPYEVVDSYCLYQNTGTECEKIDHTPLGPWPGAV